MKTVSINVYEYNELDPKIQAKVLGEFSGINVDHEWWTDTFEDADMVGIRIVNFDIEYKSIKVLPRLSMEEIIEEILKNHGEHCATYKTAMKYKGPLDLEEDFLEEIGRDYLDLLKEDFEFRQSEQAIVECIEANEYEFTKDGKIFKE